MDDDKERRKYIFRAGASYTGECLSVFFLFGCIKLKYSFTYSIIMFFKK